MTAAQKPWIKLKETIDPEDAALINGLAEECIRTDGVALKLEADYKLGIALEKGAQTAMGAVNELMCFDGEKLIGYIGIGQFGGAGSQPELNGMVHPAYRRQGVFQTLSWIAIGECRRRGAKSILLLCDRQSAAGQRFIEKTGARFHHSEFEMYLRKEGAGRHEDPVSKIAFRKALNADAHEVARQNAIYFGEEKAGSDRGLLLPEEEEKKGMTIYFALHQNQVIGKAHLQLIAGVGGIYGLGVLPEYRGKGFGRAILLGAVEKLKEAGAQEIMLQVDVHNANALHLYESCGFETTSAMDYFELANSREQPTKGMGAVEEALADKPAALKETVTIRSDLRPGDVGYLIYLHGWIYFQECGYDHGFEGYVCKTFYEFFENYRPGKDRLWFAQAEGKIIGAIAVVGHTEERAQLRWFILHPDYRGLGLGARLMGEAMGFCREKGYKDIFLFTTQDQQTAIRMYEKTGFQKVAEHEARMWGKRLTELTYELYLS